MTSAAPEKNAQNNGHVKGPGKGGRGAGQRATSNGSRPVPPPPPPRRAVAPQPPGAPPQPPSAPPQPPTPPKAVPPKAMRRSKAVASKPKSSSGQQRLAVRWWQGLGLRFKTTVMAALVGTLPVLAVGSISYYVANRAAIEEISILEKDRAIELQGTLNLFLEDRLADINNIAELGLISDPALRDSVTSQQISKALDRFMANSGNNYTSIAFFDLQGEPIAQTSAGKRLGNHLNRTYIQAAKEANGAIISEPSFSTTSGEYSIYTASVVKDLNTGVVIGYVRARIPMTKLTDILSTFAIDNTEYYLASNDGSVFLGSTAEFTTFVDSSGEAIDAAAETGEAALDLSTLFPELSPYFDLGNPVAVPSDNTLTQTDQLAAFAPSQPLDNFEDLNWNAVLSTDLSVVLAPQRRLFIAIALGTLISAVGSTALAILATRRFTQPLLDASQAVGKIGQGDLDTQLTVSGEDELAQLGNNINSMAAQLKQFTAQQQAASQRFQLLASATTIEADLSSDAGQAELNRLLENTKSVLGSERVVIYQFKAARRNKREGYISHEAVNAGLPKALELGLNDACIPPEVLQAYTDGRVYAVENVAQVEINDEHQALLKQLQVQSLLVVPVVNQNRLFGLMVAHHCTRTHRWLPEEVETFKQLGQQVGILMTSQQFEGLAEEQKTLKESLQRRALELMMEIDPVSKGDLTVRAKVTEDEIGTVADSYNATIANLRKIVDQVQTASEQMSTTVVDNKAQVQALSDGANQQTTEISEALQQIQQMVSSVKAVAASAQQAEEIVQRATSKVGDSDEAMNRTVSGIMNIRETVAETAKKVKRLGEASQKISGVVNLIGDFAAQTNLLALNASIEAARAGEEGRGFAVVADEVRSLARQSAEATVEIENLVATIQTETNEVVSAMEVGTEQVVAGTQLVNETRASLDEIAQVAEQINGLVETIAQSTQAQSSSSEAVTKVIQDVAQIAERTSTEADQVSNAFETLQEVAETLQNTVGRFKVS
ncbi:MAG: methyl-accepting chemotaxis protein [Cyanobacteria bacterium J06632_22]